MGSERPCCEGWIARRPLLRGLAAVALAGGFPGRARPAHGEGPGEVTDRALAGRYNNFVEFGGGKRIAARAQAMDLSTWTLEIAGLAQRTGSFTLSELLGGLPREQRIYPLRCVEAWTVIVPWTGIPLAALLDRIGVLPGARYVRLQSFHTPLRAVGQLIRPWLPWPYTEALRLDEARHDLCLLATGAYGEALPAQHGAPLRLVVPWKYGFKSIKSITRLELTRSQPATFWNTIAPDEYGFEANVDPDVPHPRWSQATEQRLGSSRRHRTRRFNGYPLAGLYDS